MHKRSKEIKKSRAAVFQDWGPRCAVCGSPMGLEDAHIFTRSTYPGLSAAVCNRIVLCRYHHKVLDSFSNIGLKLVWLRDNVQDKRKLDTNLEVLHVTFGPTDARVQAVFEPTD